MKKGTILIITHLEPTVTIEEQINLLEYLGRAHLANSTSEEHGITMSPAGTLMEACLVGLVLLCCCCHLLG
jgi:hypothetical protein